MAATNQPGHRTVRTYGNWRKPQSAGLMGLGSAGTALLLGGLIVVVLVVMTGGLARGLSVALALGALVLSLVVKDRHGKNALSRISGRLSWWATRSQGAHLYRSGPLGRALWGTHQLPGLAASTRLSEHTDSYGRPFAVLYTPATSNYSVVFGTEPDGASLVDQEQIDAWVSDWGHWLANLGEEPGVEAASVTIETSPDSGSRLRREVRMNTDENAPGFAQAVLDEVVASYPAGSSTVKAYVTVTFAAAARAGSRKRTDAEMGRELASRIPSLTLGLQSTGAGAARPLDAQGLCEVIRIAYDPAAATLIDEAKAAGETLNLSWTDVGPSAHEAGWDSYRHDSARSFTWSMTGAPRGTIQSGLLARLLAPHRDVDRKRVTLLYRPIDPARAAALVETDLRAAEFRMTSTNKPAARDTLAVRAAAATASEEASGAGLVNFGMLVTASITDPTKEHDARATIENLASASRLRIRPVYGSQDSAFAAALPLGLILTKHLRLPSELREKL